MKFIKTIHIPEVTLDEYAAQLKVTNEEALAILDTETVADDDHLDTATTSVSMRWYDVYEEWNKQWS